ncbi:hypothetical protein Cfor_00680 [Coptotermes formosanus]|jgi:hypothetical protein|uniref:snRNA-activating protein complex subunit 4 n=1 Tax=Coptotermes formosanus TaxID=36987 RepID=A0A6L2Q3L8_COPFO|nr:hypothetical protein Cfor_00680 [Coptotermes formosanus]
MENAGEDVYDADIANLREVLGARTLSDENEEGVEECENKSVSDEEVLDNDESYIASSDLYLDLDEILLDECAPSWKTCRTVGSACYDVLRAIEKQLVTLLEKCETKIKDLQDRIDSIKSSNEMSLSRGSWCYMFGIPYFKDQDYFPCSPNEDHFKKLANNELSIVDLPTVRLWKERDKCNLQSAVMVQEIAKRTKDAGVRKQSVVKALCGVDSATKPEDVEHQVGDCDIAHVGTKSLAELVGCSKSEYDWMKISAIDLAGNHSPDECRAMWHNYLHPMIRKTKWTADEDNKLKELVVKYKNQNWDAIAQELGTHRSAYQCMFQYQTRLNDSLRKGKWTKEEDNYLKEVVERCRFGSYIPWSKVASFMVARSKSQVFNRWAYSLNPSIKRGRFTKEENILMVAAVRRYGTDFSRVARFLPGRTSIQIRERYKTYLKYHSTGDPWTQRDDDLLMSLVAEHGEGNWSKICQHFVNRNRTQVRHRYSTLQGWLKKVPADTGKVLSAPSRRVNVETNREGKIWERVQAILRSRAAGAEMNDDNLMKLKDILEMRKRPGRKVGQTKPLSAVGRQYYNFFRCVYFQAGGRQKRHYDEDVIQNSVQVIDNMLKYFQARLNIPKDDSAIDADNLLQDVDRTLLRYLRDREEDETSPGLYNILPTGAVPNGLTVPTEAALPSQVSSAPTAHPQAELADSLDQVANISTTLSEASSLDLVDNTCEIPYLCPPSHTTLVGFRTFLLSRRNIADNAGAQSKPFVTEDSGGSSVSSSEKITPEGAAALWKERLASLFVWPAIMSNIVPKLMDSLFQNDGHPATGTSHGGSDGNTGVKRSKTHIRTKKRKRSGKVKDVAKKKRKYVKSGKYKKPSENGECVVRRRSTRHVSDPASGSLNMEMDDMEV